METREYLNNELKTGRVVITESSLLSQSFKTADNVITVTGKRIGGGFTMGKTVYHIKYNDMDKIISLDEAYKITANYLMGVA